MNGSVVPARNIDTWIKAATVAMATSTSEFDTSTVPSCTRINSMPPAIDNFDTLKRNKEKNNENEVEILLGNSTRNL